MTLRFRTAVEHWGRVFSGKGRNYDGILGLDPLLAKCSTERDRVHVGILGGAQALQNRPLAYLEGRPWRWRYPATNRGRVISRNWIEGTKFETLINDRRRQEVEGPQGQMRTSV